MMSLGGRLVQIDRNPPALMHHDRAEIVDAVGLVGMLMGQEHRVEMVDVGVDQLLAQVGRGVDHDPGRAMGGRRARPAASSGGGGFSDFWDRRRPSRAPAAARRPRNRSRESSASASCRRFRARHLGEQAEEILRGLARNLLERNAAGLAPALLRPRRHRTARCACREICRAPDTARRSRP